MTGVGTRPIAAFIAAVLVVALFAACGGSSSTTSSSTAVDTGSTSADTGGQDGSPGGLSGEDGSHSQGNAQQSQGNGQGRQDQQGHGGGEKSARVAPLEVSGGGAQQFHTTGDDNSIQEFGAEGNESELQQAAEAVHGFLASRAWEEWDRACSYLAKSNIEQLKTLVSQSPQLRDAGCAAILQRFTRPLPAAAERVVTTVDAGSLRREGELGYLMYFGTDNTPYAIPLENEGGIWKVAALAPTTLG